MRTANMIVVAATVVGLGACSLFTPTPTATVTAANDVGSAELALTAADKLALDYTSLPACPTAAPVCADPATKTKIKSLAQTAFNAVMAARANPAMLAAALTAINDLTAATPK